MPRFAANLTLMFNEYEFLDRFEAAADAGFEAVEFLFPYDHPPEAVAARLHRHKLTQALFNMPPGDWAAGDRGMAAIAERTEELRGTFAKALPYIQATDVKQVHLMAGKVPRSAGSDRTFKDNVRWYAEQLAVHGVTLVLEPLNTRDNPGYYLVDFDHVGEMIRELAIPNLKLQFDIYHCQILHGDVTMRLRSAMPTVGHVQIASVPSRHEPDGEELNFPFLFDELDRLGYDGFVGCEYRPRGVTADGLGWFQPYRRVAS